MKLLPTPNDFHSTNTETPEEWLTRRAEVQARTGTRHGPALPVVALSVLDGTPLVQDGTGPHLVTDADDKWGPYADAVHGWEEITRPAPPPTQLDDKGAPVLSPAFMEWMMGLPDGWVSGVPGVSIRQQKRILGNGVVPQQAAYALDELGW